MSVSHLPRGQKYIFLDSYSRCSWGSKSLQGHYLLDSEKNIDELGGEKAVSLVITLSPNSAPWLPLSLA